MNLPLCRVCGAGDLVPMSDYDGSGAEMLYKAWACNNEACAHIIRKGKIFRTHGQVLPDEPPPDVAPEPPDKGSSDSRSGRSSSGQVRHKKGPRRQEGQPGARRPAVWGWRAAGPGRV